jgi:replicative superfamily II helicase
MQALVAEMVGNFSKRLEPLGIIVRELTGGWDVAVSAVGMDANQ